MFASVGTQKKIMYRASPMKPALAIQSPSRTKLLPASPVCSRGHCSTRNLGRSHSFLSMTLSHAGRWGFTAA